MTVQEQIIGKVAQAKAIKMAMSYAMPTGIFKSMNKHQDKLIGEAIELNAKESGDNYWNNAKAIDEVISLEIIATY